MKVSQNNQRLQKTKYLGSSAQDRVELEDKQRVHIEFSTTPKEKISRFEYGSLERILSKDNLNFEPKRDKVYRKVLGGIMQLFRSSFMTLPFLCLKIVNALRI